MNNMELNLKENEYKLGRTTYFVSSQINEKDLTLLNLKIKKLIKKDISLLSPNRDEVTKCHTQA